MTPYSWVDDKTSPLNIDVFISFQWIPMVTVDFENKVIDNVER